MKVQQTENLLRVQSIAVFILLLQYRKNQLKKLNINLLIWTYIVFLIFLHLILTPFIVFHFIFYLIAFRLQNGHMCYSVLSARNLNLITPLVSALLGQPSYNLQKKTTCDPCILSLVLCVITISVLFLHLISMIPSILFSEMDCYSQLYRTDRTKIYTIQIKPVYWSVETIRNLRKIMDCMK